MRNILIRRIAVSNFKSDGLEKEKKKTHPVEIVIKITCQLIIEPLQRVYDNNILPVVFLGITKVPQRLKITKQIYIHCI